MSTLTRHVALVSESSSVSLAQLTPVAAAMQKQVTRDFGPIWGIHATVDAFENLDSVPVDYWPVILKDNINQPGAAGFHTGDNGQPLALVQVDATWPLTVSHETLEMLADPSGNATVAGAPPPQAPKPVSGFKRVVYLREVCDPCEDGSFAYSVNGVQLSDFITPHYYDPGQSSGVRYSFTGAVKQPHWVLDGGYVSFGNPKDNEWYQIFVEGKKVQLRKLGVIKASGGKSLREAVDGKVRVARVDDRYRLKPATAAALKPPDLDSFADEQAVRASKLREFIRGLR